MGGIAVSKDTVIDAKLTLTGPSVDAIVKEEDKKPRSGRKLLGFYTWGDSVDRNGNL